MREVGPADGRKDLAGFKLLALKGAIEWHFNRISVLLSIQNLKPVTAYEKVTSAYSFGRFTRS